jgi:hypothetical protein
MQQTETQPKKNSFFTLKFDSIEDSISVIKSSANQFYVYSLLVLVVYWALSYLSWDLEFSLLISIVPGIILILLLAFFMNYLRSRVFAVILMLLSIWDFIATVMVKLGVVDWWGENIYLAAVILWISIRAVSATFTYNSLVKKS